MDKARSWSRLRSRRRLPQAVEVVAEPRRLVLAAERRLLPVPPLQVALLQHHLPAVAVSAGASSSRNQLQDPSSGPHERPSPPGEGGPKGRMRDPHGLKLLAASRHSLPKKDAHADEGSAVF